MGRLCAPRLLRRSLHGAGAAPQAPPEVAQLLMEIIFIGVMYYSQMSNKMQFFFILYAIFLKLYTCPNYVGHKNLFIH